MKIFFFIVAKSLFSSLSLDYNSFSSSFSFSTFLICLFFVFLPQFHAFFLAFFVFFFHLFLFLLFSQFFFSSKVLIRYQFFICIAPTGGGGELSLYEKYASIDFCKYFSLSFQSLNFKWKLFLSSMSH